MAIHLGLPTLDADGEEQPFCGAVLVPGELISHVRPTTGRRVACIGLSAEVIVEASRRLGPDKNTLSLLNAEVRRVRDEILHVGLVAWVRSHPELGPSDPRW